MTRSKRLSSASATHPVPAQAWTQGYSYDGFGNLFAKTGTGVAAPFAGNWSASLNSNTNRFGSTDLNGNPSGSGAPVFDIQNRMTTPSPSSNETYIYAPDNKRIARVRIGGKKLIDFYSGNLRLGTYELTSYVENDETTYVTQTVNTELYLSGRRLALADRLGSANGVRLLPYGEEISPTLNDRVKFATYFRNETGLDYADQRYYSAGLGRFLNPDPSQSARLSDPSSWNKYAYTQGDPVNRNDPGGWIGIILPKANAFRTTICRRMMP